MTWAAKGGREQYQKIRNEELIKKRYTPSDSSLLPCENLDTCYEAIKIHELIWNIFLWAYATMNVNEYLTPFIAVNNDGYRKLRPSQGDGSRSMISSKVRSVLSNAILVCYGRRHSGIFPTPYAYILRCGFPTRRLSVFAYVSQWNQHNDSNELWELPGSHISSRTH